MNVLRRVLLYSAQPYAVEIMKPLQAAALRRGCQVRWFFESSSAGASLLSPDEERLYSVADVKSFDPQAVFVPGNDVPDFFPGVKVGIFHGFSVGKRSEERGHFRIRGFFDLYCTQGPATTIPFQELSRRYGHFKVVETGWPKVDPLFSDVQELFAKKGRPVVLYTSTFTPRLSSARVLFTEIKRLIEERDWHWLITLHPKMDSTVKALYSALEGRNVEYFPPGDIMSLYKRADVMLSDTSSTVPEFLLQQKPVVTFKNNQPGPHIIDVSETNEVEAALELALQRPPKLLEAIKSYCDDIHPMRDGYSSERVLDAVESFIIEGGRAHLKKKPINLIRKIKIRKKLGYYLWW